MHSLLLAIAIVVSTGSSRPDAAALLDRTVWIDIGIGRTLAAMKPTEKAALRRCKEPTMYFEKTDKGVAETFYSGMMMRTEYTRASVTRNPERIVILLFVSNDPKPAETLQLMNRETVLVQQTRGFRPHTLLRCTSLR